MDFASILSAEYGDVMLKKGTPENVDTWPIGTGPPFINLCLSWLARVWR
jgi:hypothetical protein